MTQEEIVYKAYNLILESNKSTKKEPTHHLYNDAVEMAKHISYHAVKGVFPDELFKHRSPNETKAESDYM